MRDFGRVVPAVPDISHAILLNVFHGLKSDRWNSADYGVMVWRADVELHAELREFPFQGHCTPWVGIALLSCQCNAVLSGALVLYLVHCFVAMKPVTPLRARVSAGLKPVTPLRAENVGFSGVEGSQW